MLKGTHCHNLKGKVFEINRQKFHGTQYLIIYEGVTDDVVVTYLPSCHELVQCHLGVGRASVLHLAYAVAKHNDMN